MTMTRTAIALTLLSSAAIAQTSSTTPRRTTTHRTAATAAKPAGAATANPADTPPNVPPIQGTPKPLYSLRYVDTVIGTGALAEPRKYYTVRYTGWLTDGTKFDSSEDHPGKEPISFPYGAHRVIPGWDTGFEGMRIGGKRRLYIPYQLAYGESGRPPVIPAKADLIFDLELVSISDTDPTQPEPPTAQNPNAPAGAPTGAPTGATPDSSTPPAKPTTPVDPTKPTAAPAPASTTTPPTKPQSK